METLATRIRAERKRLKLTQEQLAKKVDPDSGQSLISNLERGVYLSSPFLPEIAHVIGVDAYWLKTGKGSRQGASRALSADEQLLIEALPHLNPVVKEMWLNSARTTLDELAAASKAA